MADNYDILKPAVAYVIECYWSFPPLLNNNYLLLKCWFLGDRTRAYKLGGYSREFCSAMVIKCIFKYA